MADLSKWLGTPEQVKPVKTIAPIMPGSRPENTPADYPAEPAEPALQVQPKKSPEAAKGTGKYRVEFRGKGGIVSVMEKDSEPEAKNFVNLLKGFNIFVVGFYDPAGKRIEVPPARKVPFKEIYKIDFGKCEF